MAAGLVALAGCGGGGSGDGGGGGGGTPPPTGGVTVNLADRPGQLELTYLLGQGRSGVRAVGDVVALINNRIAISGPSGTLAPSVGERSYDLAKYSNNILRINVPVTGADSVSFDTYTLSIDSIRAEFPDGVVSSPGADGLPFSIPIGLKLFPGRYTSLPVFLNDGQFDFTGGGATFLPQVFLDDNALNDTSSPIQGFLSDYLAFDITSIPAADRPTLEDGTPAERVYLSGDNYAVSKAASGFGTANERGRFQLISRTISADAETDFGPYIDGRYAPPRTFGETTTGAAPALTVPGTYSLIQDDPSQPPIEDEPGSETDIAKIVSIQGIWRDFARQLSNMPAEFAIALPSTRDDSVQDFLLIKQSGGKVSAANFGSVDLATGELFLVPLRDLVTADTTAVPAGTVSGLVGSSGATTTSPTAVRRGTYTLNGEVAPGFARTGAFVVYRR